MTPAMHLESYFAECRVRRFDWHSNHCGNFSAGWVERAEHRKLDLPDSLQDQIRLRDRCGGVAQAVSFLLGREPMGNKKLAQPGDIVLLPSRRPERSYIGICSGRYAAFLPMSGEELAFVAMAQVECAWSVSKELLT